MVTQKKPRATWNLIYGSLADNLKIWNSEEHLFQEYSPSLILHMMTDYVLQFPSYIGIWLATEFILGLKL